MKQKVSEIKYFINSFEVSQRWSASTINLLPQMNTKKYQFCKAVPNILRCSWPYFISPLMRGGNKRSWPFVTSR